MTAFVPVPYFPVSLQKLVVMNVATLGIYQFYWFFHHWQQQRIVAGADVRPGWRTVFAIFFCYSLLKRQHDDAAAVGHPRETRPGLLAAGWIFFYFVGHIDGLMLLLVAAVGFLLPGQAAANAVNAVRGQGYDPNDRYSFWNVLAIVLSLFVYAGMAANALDVW